MPCLKCKVRIALTPAQLDKLDEADGQEAGLGAPAAPPPAPVPAPAPEPVPEPAQAPPVPIPSPSSFASPAEFALYQAFNGNGEASAVVAALAEPASVYGSPPVPSTSEPAGDKLAFICPTCKARFPVRTYLAGKRIRCPRCTNIVKVNPSSDIIPGFSTPGTTSKSIAVHETASQPGVPAAPVPSAPAKPTAQPLPPSQPAIPASASVPEREELERLRQEIAEARDSASAAEEMLQQFSREKIKNEIALLRKAREAEAQARDLATRVTQLENEQKIQAEKSKAHQDILIERETENSDLKRLLETHDAQEIQWDQDRQALEERLAALSSDLQAKVTDLHEQVKKGETENAALAGTLKPLENRVRELGDQISRQAEGWKKKEEEKDAEIEAFLKQTLELEESLKQSAITLKEKEAAWISVREDRENEVQTLKLKLDERSGQADKQQAELTATIQALEEKVDALTRNEKRLNAVLEGLETGLKKEIDSRRLFLDGLKRQFSF